MGGFDDLTEIVWDGEADVEDPASIVHVGVVSVRAPFTCERLDYLPRDELVPRGKDVGHPGIGETSYAGQTECCQEGLHGDGLRIGGGGKKDEKIWGKIDSNLSGLG